MDKKKRGVCTCHSLHTSRLWHSPSSLNEQHQRSTPDMLINSHVRNTRSRHLPKWEADVRMLNVGCEYTHPEDIYCCLVPDEECETARFRCVKSKTSVNALSIMYDFAVSHPISSLYIRWDVIAWRGLNPRTR